MDFVFYNQFAADRKEFGIEYAANHAKELGFNAVEYVGRAPTGTLETAAKEKEVLDRLGLKVACYSVGIQLFTEEQEKAEQLMFDELQAAKLLGAKFVHHTLCPIVNRADLTHTYDEIFEKVVDSAARIAKYANELGIVCLYEPQGLVFNGIEGLGKIYRAVRERGCDVGICGDFTNPFFVDERPEAIFKEFAPEIRHVHIEDYLVCDAPIEGLQGYRSRDGKYLYSVEVGKGVVDFAEGFSHLKNAGYHGAVSFEFRADDDQNQRTLTLLKKLI